MKANALARGWNEVDPTSEEGSDPEWWVVVAMKDPVPEPSTAYREALSGHASCGAWTVTAFERYYDNPWVVRALVSRGLRATSSSLLMTMAREVFDRSTPFSADAGASLCVLAYGYASSAAIPGWLTAALQSYCLAPDGNPHVERWRISNEYALARIDLEAGRTDEARALFERCARRDCLRFSPLLGTKTIDAAFWAGWLAMQARDTAGAGQWWTRGLEEARRVLGADWTNVIGSMEEPLLFGMRELTDVTDLASRCASGLHLLTEFGDRPGVAAAQTWRSLGGLLQAREHELALTRRSMNAISVTVAAERRWRAEHEAAMAAGMDAMEAAVAFTRDEARKRVLAYEAALEAEREHITLLKSSLDASIAHAASLEEAVGAAQSDRQRLRRTWVALALRLAAADPRGVAIFGAGQGGRQFAQEWRQKGGQVACFVDNNAETWGTVIDGIPVEPPFALEARRVALVIVASLAHAAISEQLTRMNLVEGQDFISWVNVPGVDGHDHDA
jgi:hypothetical protein